MMRDVATVCLSIMPVVVGNAVARGDDWPHWRGPHRTDVVAEDSGWRNGSWKGKTPLGRPLWDANVGIGSSSPVIVGGKLYTMGWRKNRDAVSCLDAATGKQVWQVSYQSPQYGRRSTGDKRLYSGSTSTPEFDVESGYLYTLGIDGDLHCWDTRNRGARVWAMNLYDKYKVGQRPKIGRGNKLRDYGYTTSPLIYENSLIVEVGDDEGNLMAFDKRNGKRLWTSQSTDPAGHSGGLVPMTVEGIPCVAVLTVWNLLVVRLDRGHEGETIAEYEWKTEYANNIPTPAVHQNQVLITSAYNHFAICRLEITQRGARKVWEQPQASGVCSPIIHKGYVYWAWESIAWISPPANRSGKAATWAPQARAS